MSFYSSSVATSANIHGPDMRTAGRELLSLALIDTRNRSLQFFSQLESLWEAQAYPVELARSLQINPPHWDLGYLGWYQERWIGRNLHRRKGPSSLSLGPPLAALDPGSDQLWGRADVYDPLRWGRGLPSVHAVRAYALETLELTLHLLDRCEDEDDALYFFRRCLFLEDAFVENRLRQAQMLGLAVDVPALAVYASRQALAFPSGHWVLGSVAKGYVPSNEMERHEVYLPEFEIDAQPVHWAQYSEFVNDGGYDKPALWAPSGWAWRCANHACGGDGVQRAPRYVEQIGSASGMVIQNRFGKPTGLPGNQPVMHVNWWEADAFARWIGRRLPSEAEWELAAHTATRKGWRWGDVWEWMGDVYRPYPGFRQQSFSDAEDILFGRTKTIRGASFATHGRLRSPKQRAGLDPSRNDLFLGFRTCAI